MAELGDKTTLYSYQHDKIVKTEAECVGHMPDGTTVWHFDLIDWSTHKRAHAYHADDGRGNNMGYYFSQEKAFDHMVANYELKVVMNNHMAGIIAAQQADAAE